MKRKTLAGVGLLITAGFLTGCSGGSDIKSIDDLRTAYVGEGFDCATPTFEDEDTYQMFGCENQVMLTYISDKAGEKRHVETSEIMGDMMTLYVQADGDWRISSFDRSLLASNLGGEIKTYGE